MAANLDINAILSTLASRVRSPWYTSSEAGDLLCSRRKAMTEMTKERRYFGVLTSKGTWLTGLGDRGCPYLLRAQAIDASTLALELGEAVTLVWLTEPPKHELMVLP